MPTMRAVAAIAAVASGLTFTGWSSLTAAASAPRSFQGQPPRDPRPGVARPATARENALQAATATDPSNVANWLELARLQEERGALTDAEASLTRAVSASGSSQAALHARASFLMRTGQFEKATAALEDAASRTPGDTNGYQLIASYYLEKVTKDASLGPADKLRYLQAGIAATDRSLALQPDYVDGLVYKSVLLRVLGGMETDPARRNQMFAEADGLRDRAMELSKSRSNADVTTATPTVGGPPQPPPPPSAPVRVGGTIKAPDQIKRTAPVYPAEAMQAGVSGMVILEVVIETDGTVRSAKVLRSVPLLDQAAVDAVKQWQYTPTLLNGVPVPVIMTVTVNFTLE